MTRAARAFSIVELLVVISVIAVLIGLLLPALGGTRQKARDVSGLADLRSGAGAVAAHASGRGDDFPSFDTPEGIDGVRSLPGTNESPGYTRGDYINAHSRFWHRVVWQGEPTPEFMLLPRANADPAEEPVDPADPAHDAGRTVKFWMAYAGYAQNAYFALGEGQLSYEEARPLRGLRRLSDASFPSKKALLVNLRSPFFIDPERSGEEGGEIDAAFIDGSAERFTVADGWFSRVMPVERPQSPHPPGLATRDGLGGVDR